VDARRPDAAILVDYPDFNLRLAGQLHRRGIPVLYYVSPQVWAWRRGRIKSIRRTVSRMLVIFPFEESLYREAGVPTSFVGHPLVDLVRPVPDREAFLSHLGLDPGRPVLAMLPGSRPKEVAHNLPPLVRAVELLAAERRDLQFVLALSHSVDESSVREGFKHLPVRIVPHQTHGVLGASTAAIVASGTATVEAALLGTPMVVVYRVSPLTYYLGRPLVSVPHFAMVNLIAGREIVKELMQRDFTGEHVAREALALIEDDALRDRIKKDLAEVRQRLGQGGASDRAASEVQEVLALQSEKA
jgi:lipid-A-disaccharide synthase